MVVSSPFLRCIQTATHAYMTLDLPGLHIWNSLCEFLSPMCAMTSTPAVPATEEAENTVFLSLDSEPLPKFPETREECYARYRCAVDSVADHYWPDNVLMVTHQGCVQEAVNWGGKMEDVEATYCSHVELSRTSKEDHIWVWREDCGIFTYDKLIP